MAIHEPELFTGAVPWAEHQALLISRCDTITDLHQFAKQCDPDEVLILHGSDLRLITSAILQLQGRDT